MTDRRRQNLRRIATGVLVVFGGACSEHAVPTAPTRHATAPLFDNTLAEGTIPYESAGVVTCGSATISVTGQGTLSYRTRQDNSGGLHFDVTIDETLTGNDLAAGVSYSGSSTSNNTTNVPEPPFETTMTEHTRITAQGSADNHMVHTTFHLTMNANGQLTSSVSEMHCD